MFTNLVESSSHAGEFKRRGSFFLFTTITYAVLFAVAGVLSIYAYDAQLKEPASEITMLSPIDFAPPQPTSQVRPAAADNVSRNNSNQAERREAFANVDEPTIVPKNVSADPPTSPPVPRGVPFTIGNRDTDPANAGRVPGSGGANGAGVSTTDPVIDVGTPPIPPPVEKRVPKVLRKSILNGEAISLPKPAYPPIAKQIRAQGAVTVQVLVDESGRVVSAKVVNGNPVLAPAAQRAAMQAKFSPTMLGDQPVKVSGVITYNFVLQ